MRLKITLFLSTVFLQVFAQDFSNDMQLVNEKFAANPNVSFRIDYVLRAEHKMNSRVISRNTGRYVRRKEVYLSVYDKKATLVTANEVIMLDGDDRTIRVKKLTSAAPTQSPDFFAQLKEYNKNVKEIKRTVLDKHRVQYDVILKNTQLFPISHYELTIDVESGYLQQMTLFYKKPLGKDPNFNLDGSEVPRLEILFSAFNQSSVFDKSELSAGYYYYFSSDKLTPSTHFKGYTIKEIK